MRLIAPLTAVLLAIPTITLAQAADTDQPGAASSPPSSSTTGASPSSDAAGRAASGSTSMTSPSTAGATVTAGLPVKDKSGATIGSVTEVKSDAAGNKVATIRMGADTFAVDTSALAVDHGAAVINATQAEIKSMMSKGK